MMNNSDGLIPPRFLWGGTSVSLWKTPEKEEDEEEIREATASLAGAKEISMDATAAAV